MPVFDFSGINTHTKFTDEDIERILDGNSHKFHKPKNDAKFKYAMAADNDYD